MVITEDMDWISVLYDVCWMSCIFLSDETKGVQDDEIFPELEVLCERILKTHELQHNSGWYLPPSCLLQHDLVTLIGIIRLIRKNDAELRSNNMTPGTCSDMKMPNSQPFVVFGYGSLIFKASNAFSVIIGVYNISPSAATACHQTKSTAPFYLS